MKHERERLWPAALSRALGALATGGDAGAILNDLLRHLAQEIGAESCAVARLCGDRLECRAAVPSAEAALAGIDATRRRDGDAVGIVVRRGPDGLIMALRPGGTAALGADGRRRLDDVLALAALAERARTARQPEADGLHRLVAGQALSLELIDGLLAAPFEGLDAAIDTGLARLGAFAGSDRVYIFQITGEGLMSNTHEWCAPGIAPMRDRLQDLPVSVADPWWPALRDEGQVHVADVAALAADDPLRGILAQQGIRALLVVPLRQEGQVTGFMGYDSVREARSFSPAEIRLLRAVSSIVATLLARRRTAARTARAHALHDEERQRLQATLRALPDTVLELDGGLRIAALHAGGASPVASDDPKGQSVDDACPPPLAALVHEIRSELDRGHAVVDRRLAVPQGDRVHWYSVSAAGRCPTDGAATAGYVVVLRDVTERQSQRLEIEKLGRIVRTTTNLVLTTDAQGRIDWVNPAFEARTGYSLAQARGQKPGALLQGPETDPDTIARIRAALAAGRPITTDIQNRTRTGEAYWVELNIQPLTDPDGRIVGFMSVQTDTTQHRDHARRLERALMAEKAARDRLQSAVDTMQEGFVLFDAEQRLVLCNAVFGRIFPALAAHLQPGADYRSVLEAGIATGDFARLSSDSEAWLAAQIEAFARGERRSSVVSRGGRWYQHTQLPTPDGGRIGLFTDVTELKDAELRALAERARAMDASRDGIAQVAAEGTIRYANAAAARILGLSGPDALEGRNWREILRLGELPEGMLSADGWQGALQLTRADGTPTAIELSATRDEDGSALCILRDVNDRLRAEAERERLAEELGLARRRADLSLVAMGLGHDLNNLLSAISGAASLIEADGAPMVRAMAEQIATAVEQAAALVKRLMKLGRPSAEKGWTDLRGPLQDAATLVRGGLRPPLRLELSLPDTPVMARLDPTGVMQMALNLCINARDALITGAATGEAGVIRLSLSRDDPDQPAPAFDIGHRDPAIPHARITILDNGPGMDDATRAQVFTPYFSTKGDRGTGLGLPIAAEVVKDHGGALALETAPGKGARFTILLPIAAP